MASPVEMPVIHVAAAAISGADGRLLISRRPDHLHQGGLLEFPGGKVDPGESVTQALVRELQEELGITPLAFQPLIQIPFDYPDKRVLLDVWRVSAYQGEPRGLEGQSLYWLAVDELVAEQFPAANRPIITALRLPSRYLITGPAAAREDWLSRLERALDSGIRLVQLRAPELDGATYAELARQTYRLCQRFSAQLILNRDLAELEGLKADGVHLNRHQLKRLNAEQLEPWRQGLIGASCHDAEELAQAQGLGLDYALLSPVLDTKSHPDAIPLGWGSFSHLITTAALPVYALGGMTPEMEAKAIACGGQGIASIRAYW